MLYSVSRSITVCGVCRMAEPKLDDKRAFVLMSLLHQPKHGYALAKHVSTLSEGRFKLSASTMYDTLAALYSAGLIEPAGDEEVRDGKFRRVYHVTGIGQRSIKEYWRVSNRFRSLVPGMGTMA